jgi:hypothetical protein
MKQERADGDDIEEEMWLPDLYSYFSPFVSFFSFSFLIFHFSFFIFHFSFFNFRFSFFILYFINMGRKTRKKGEKKIKDSQSHGKKKSRSQVQKKGQEVGKGRKKEGRKKKGPKKTAFDFLKEATMKRLSPQASRNWCANSQPQRSQAKMTWQTGMTAMTWQTRTTPMAKLMRSTAKRYWTTRAKKTKRRGRRMDTCLQKITERKEGEKN